MDDQNKNLILATVLSFLVILVWFVVFPPPEPVPDTDPPATEIVDDDPLTPPAAPGEDVAPGDQPEVADTVDMPRNRHRDAAPERLDLADGRAARRPVAAQLSRDARR
jgi:hypothetical protein